MIADPVTRMFSLWAMTTKKMTKTGKKNSILLLLLFLLNFQLLKEAKETFFYIYIYKCIYFTFKNSDVQND